MFHPKLPRAVNFGTRAPSRFPNCVNRLHSGPWTVDLPYQTEAAKMSVNHHAAPQWATQKHKAIPKSNFHVKLPKYAMQATPDDGIFYFDVIRERETVFSLLLYQMVYPEETNTQFKKMHIFSDCSMEFLNYFPCKTTSHLCHFKKCIKCLKKHYVNNNGSGCRQTVQ